jgi:HK97 family phage portal protein
MFQSGGVLTKGPDQIIWRGSTATVPTWLFRGLGYAELYRTQPWVATVVDKLANSGSRLPLKTYRRDEDGRPEVREHPYAALIRRPSQRLSPFALWRWTWSTESLFGEAWWYKFRDQGGRPVYVEPVHPSRLESEYLDSGEVRWWLLDSVGARRQRVPRRDLVRFSTFNPGDMERGLSPLEPLRATLENEYGARSANSALWRNGGRPSVVLEHPRELSDAAVTRLSASWHETHGGVDNWAKAAILEDGLTAKVLPLNAEDLQYVEGRKLNREEVCARYDIPPPVVHILDRATFSNITEQMRSMYRDTMGWRLAEYEATLEHELRDGSYGEGEPDFGAEVYSEFLLNDVLRGDFEQRMMAYQQADFMTIAEKRQRENLPAIAGTDRLYVNSASLPIGSDGRLEGPTEAPMDAKAVRSVMGRLGRYFTLDEVDAEAVVKGLGPATAARVTAAIDAATSLDDLRAAVRALEEPCPT